MPDMWAYVGSGFSALCPSFQVNYMSFINLCTGQIKQSEKPAKKFEDIKPVQIPALVLLFQAH
jgi:hypothetical protein